MQPLTDNLILLFTESNQTAEDAAEIVEARVSFQRFGAVVASTKFEAKDPFKSRIDEFCQQSEKLELALTRSASVRS